MDELESLNELGQPKTKSLRQDLADIPSMDAMIELYEKVLAELDSAISSAKDFSSGAEQKSTRHGKESSN